MYLFVTCMETEITLTDCCCFLSQPATDLWKETPFTPALKTVVHTFRQAQADADTKYCITQSSVYSYKVFVAS